jgi:hypothetical protein
VTPPRPEALRLVTRATSRVRPSAPFGLRGWSLEASALAVFLEVASDEPRGSDLVEQIPPPADLPPGTCVLVLGSAARDRDDGWLARLRPRTVTIARAPRCQALLMRGYVRLGAGVDPATRADLAWGFSSLC